MKGGHLMTLAETIKDFRVNELHLSSEEFAIKADLPISQVYAIEKGLHKPTLKTYRRLSKITGIPVKNLVEMELK